MTTICPHCYAVTHQINQSAEEAALPIVQTPCEACLAAQRRTDELAMLNAMWLSRKEIVH